MELFKKPVNKSLKIYVSLIYISLLFHLFISCDLLKNNEDPAPGNNAFLITPTIIFNSGESGKLFWTKMLGPGFLIYSGSDQITPAVLEFGSTVPITDSITFYQSFDGNSDVGAIEFKKSTRDYFIRFDRNSGSNNLLVIEVEIKYNDPVSIFNEDNLLKNIIYSPVISFPSGSLVNDLGEGSASFANFVNQTYLYDYTAGIAFLRYMLIHEIPYIDFADPVGIKPRMNPLSIEGPKPPPGAEHDDNYCGLSVFIHSMITTFPDALPVDVTTNPAEWDKIGDAIGHSNYFGERAAKLVSNVNENFGTKTTYVENGKKYRAQILQENISSSDLSMMMEMGCNIKLLIYDIPEFGHWVDVIGVNGMELTLQDYEDSMTVTYQSYTGTIDFSSAPSSTTRDHFSGMDYIAGNGPFESITFVSVCEIE